MIKVRKRRLSKSPSKVILLVIVTLSILVIAPNVPRSYAHAFVVSSSPAPSSSVNTPPSQVEVDFIDPIDIRYSQIKVLDSNGKAIQNNDWHYISKDHTQTVVTLPQGVPNGIYTVYTKVLDATDGHSTENAFVFAIGEPVPQNFINAKTTVSFSNIISIPDAIARYPSLVGQIIVVGAGFSSFWLWRPISKISTLSNAFKPARNSIDKSMTKIALIGSIIVLGGDFAMIVSEAYSINSGILEAIGTSFGNLWTIRLVLSLALFGFALAVYLKQKNSSSILSKSHISAIFGLGIAVLSTTTLISHGAASGKILPPIFDFAHNIVASLWIGSVIYLAFIVAPRLRQIQDDRTSMSVLSIIIPRFSTIVVALLGIVIMTGPSLLYVLENNLSLTLASIYGEILVVKLSLAGVMIGLGAFNQIVIHRKALKTILIASPNISNVKIDDAQNSASETNGKSVLSQFSRNIKIEAIIGMVLIASIALLVDSGLPATQFQNELVQQQQQVPHVFAFANPLNSFQNQFTETAFTSDGNRIVLSVEPFLAGNNNVTISFLDQNKSPININSTKITLYQVDKGIGPIEVDDAQKVSQGVFSVNTDSFAIAGHWQAQVEGITIVPGALNVVSTFNDLYVKPNLNQLQANITEYKIPDIKSMPLYPIYDNIRNVVWVGDSGIGTGRIWEFDLDTKQYTEHKINGTIIVTASALDFNNNIWYIDPITKVLGYYEPDSNKSQTYTFPEKAIISGLAIDNLNNPWITLSNVSQVLKFDVPTKTFHSIKLPVNSIPLGISIDQSTGQVWVAESKSGKIANIDPAQNYKITEYSPANGTLSSPTAILFDSVTGKVFVSEHDGKALSVLDPLLGTFQKYGLDPQGLPFGMVFDLNHDLWIAQHTIDKIAVLDPRTGKNAEFDIPAVSSFTQWVTVDSQGHIIMAEWREHALGLLTSTVKQGFVENTETSTILGLPLGFSYTDIAGPAIAVGLVSVSFFYSKSAIDLKNSIRQVKKDHLESQ